VHKARPGNLTSRQASLTRVDAALLAHIVSGFRDFLYGHSLLAFFLLRPSGLRSYHCVVRALGEVKTFILSGRIPCLLL
jgi:hypothetical protein